MKTIKERTKAELLKEIEKMLIRIKNRFRYIYNSDDVDYMVDIILEEYDKLRKSLENKR